MRCWGSVLGRAGLGNPTIFWTPVRMETAAITHFVAHRKRMWQRVCSHAAQASGPKEIHASVCECHLILIYACRPQ